MASKRHLARVLRDGANFLEKHNWTRGVLYRSNSGSFCAVGAVRMANALDPYGILPGGIESLLHIAFRSVHGVYMDVFNDTVAKSKKEVVSAMRTTARELEHGLDLEKFQ